MFGIVNWKTTLLGALLGVANYLSEAMKTDQWDDPKTIIVSALCIALGYVAKDAGISGTAK